MLESTVTTAGQRSGGGSRLRSLTVKAATRGTVTEYYGESQEPTIRGKVFYLDDEPVAIMGLARMKDGRVLLFSDHKEEFEPHMRRITAMRAIREVMEMTNEIKVDIDVVSTNKASAGLLARYGFEDLTEQEE